jgi:dodecin
LVPDTLKSEQIGIEDDVQRAITKAAETLHDLRWLQIVESRGYIEDGKVDYWQVTIKRL